jgi:small subunit ribosomal protein S9
MVSKKQNTIISGKRKTAVAKLYFTNGSGQISYNKLPYTSLSTFHKLALLEPIKIYQAELGENLKHDFQITTRSGGKESQIQAARLAIAKALIHITSSDVLKKAFIKYDRNMIVPDSRRKETCKPGDSKARAKRQKSFR